MGVRWYTGLFLAVVMLLSGCGDTSISCPPADETTTDGVTTSSTSVSTSTTSTHQTTTTTAEPITVVSVPPARELLGQTYGDFLELTDGDCRIIHARFHTDVAFGLESDRLPHYELAEADNALRDWESAVYLEMGTALSADMLRTEQMITAVYVKEGGFVTHDLKAGDKMSVWKKVLPSLPDVTIMYDFVRGFNKDFYGYIDTTIEGAQARIYVDLTTDQAVQALAAQGITLGTTTDPATDPNMGKTVSLPDLPIGGVRIWLKNQG